MSLAHDYDSTVTDSPSHSLSLEHSDATPSSQVVAQPIETEDESSESDDETYEPPARACVGLSCYVLLFDGCLT